MLRYRIPISEIDISESGTTPTFGYFFFIETGVKKSKKTSDKVQVFHRIYYLKVLENDINIDNYTKKEISDEHRFFEGAENEFTAENPFFDSGHKFLYQDDSAKTGSFFSTLLGGLLEGKEKKEMPALDNNTDLFFLSKNEMMFLNMGGPSNIVVSGAKIILGHLEDNSLEKDDWFTLKFEAESTDSNLTYGDGTVVPQIILATPCPPLWKPQVSPDPGTQLQIINSVQSYVATQKMHPAIPGPGNT